MTAHRLTRDQARRLVVRAQLLDAQRPGDVVEVAEQLAYIKIDPTAVITTSEHAMLVLIDHTLGGIAKDVFFTEAVASSLADLQYELASTPFAFLEPIEPAAARRRLQQAFAITDGLVEPRINEELAPHRALALARIRQLPPSIESVVPARFASVTFSNRPSVS